MIAANYYIHITTYKDHSSFVKYYLVALWCLPFLTDLVYWGHCYCLYEKKKNISSNMIWCSQCGWVIRIWRQFQPVLKRGSSQVLVAQEWKVTCLATVLETVCHQTLSKEILNMPGQFHILITHDVRHILTSTFHFRLPKILIWLVL